MNAPAPVKRIMGRLLPTPIRQKQDAGLALFERREATVTMSMETYRWVLAIVTVFALYFVFIASDRYAVVSQVFIKSSQTSAPSLATVPIIGTTSPGLQDAMLVRDYMTSRDMMRILDEKLGLRAHYSDSQWDFVSRLSKEATEEEFHEYYLSRIALSLDDAAAILDVRVQAYSADFARLLSQQILTEAEAFINNVGQKIARDEIGFVEAELELARQKVLSAQGVLLAFQNDNQLLDAEQSSAALQDRVNGLLAQITTLETEETTLASFLNDEAAELVSVRERLKALRDQLAKERGKLASSDQQALNEITARFAQLRLEVNYATDLYRNTLKSLEQARVEAYKKLKHLVVVQSPTVPQKAEYPRRLYNIMTILVALSLAYGVIIMIWATVREHRDV